MKNIKVLIVTALLLHASSIYADEMKSARSEANKFAANMINNKFKAVAKMTHPGLVESLGGIDEYADSIAATYKEADFSFKKLKFTKIGKINTSGKFAVAKFPYESLVTAGKESFDGNSFFVGFSKNKTKWYFVDCGGLTQDLIKILSPGYDGNLNLDGC